MASLVPLEHDAILERFDSLVKTGVVLYDENQQLITYDDRGYKFEFRIASPLRSKPSLHTPNAAVIEDVMHPDFGSIDVCGFEICTVNSGTHLLAANKYCFARPQLLLLTTDPRIKQYEPLDRDDLAAAWQVLGAMGDDDEHVVFFNCGEASSCSRLHKHMQVMPFSENHNTTSVVDGSLGSSEGFVGGTEVPFQTFSQRFDTGPMSAMNADGLVTVYERLLSKATMALQKMPARPLTLPMNPHNVVLTKRLMLVVPRRKAGINGADANAMGMLGLVAVPDRQRMQDWVRQGPLDVLAELGVPMP